ncbi:MAG TPA: DUF1572 family protein [Thermoanaerobaculia bacterium]|nr:DUF1572 family protein [Thermoanaerobaculia bacterium]
MEESPSFAEPYLSNLAVELRKLKSLADRAVAQVRDDDLFAALDPESNSLAILLQHLSGSLRSRFTDFLTTDGEKPDRHRDGEFEVAPGTARGDVLARWEEGWRRLLETVDGLGAADLGRTVTIRGEPHIVLQALQRALGHCAYHTGQIVLLAKHARSSNWQTLTVPRGKSEELNRKMAARAEPGRRETASKPS